MILVLLVSVLCRQCSEALVCVYFHAETLSQQYIVKFSLVFKELRSEVSKLSLYRNIQDEYIQTVTFTSLNRCFCVFVLFQDSSFKNS